MRFNLQSSECSCQSSGGELHGSCLHTLDVSLKAGGACVQSGETPLMLAAKDSETEVVAALEDALKIDKMRKEAGASALLPT